MKNHIRHFLSLLTLASALVANANPIDTGSSVVVVYNTAVKESEGVARHYAARRIVPRANVIGLEMPVTEEISRADFTTKLQQPLLAELEKRKLMSFVDGRVVGSKLRYVTLCYGVPLKIRRDANLKEEAAAKLPEQLRPKNEAAVDSELAWLPRAKGKAVLSGALGNVFHGTTNLFNFSANNGILMVGRLDGPTPDIAKRLVDAAINCETNGFWGRAYFDLRGIKSGEYAEGDKMLRSAVDHVKKWGIDVVVDENESLFDGGFPMSHAGIYAGWYSENIGGVFTNSRVEFMPGAFAYHLHSLSASTVRSDTKNWVGPLITKGASASMGTVYEPFLTGTPDIGLFLERFTKYGFSLGEAAYASQQSISWMTTVVGDPLYRPNARHPRLLHQDLEKRQRPEAEWSLHRVASLNVSKGTNANQMIQFLTGMRQTPNSAVLLEKLGELYQSTGSSTNAARMWGRALQTRQSRQQHKRLVLNTAELLAKIGMTKDAQKLYELFVTKFPNYPQLADVRAKLAKLN